MAAGGPRQNKVHKAMNRPLTILGAERRLFFVALIAGGAVFSLIHSLLGGILLFIVGVVIARIATKHDVEILRVLFNSGKFRRRYDPMQWQPTEIKIKGQKFTKRRTSRKVFSAPSSSISVRSLSCPLKLWTFCCNRIRSRSICL